MTLKTVSGVSVDIADDEIIAAAGRIYSARRSVHRGGIPRLRSCRWCDVGIAGKSALRQHERSCDRRPSGEYVAATDADIANWLTAG